MDRELCIGLIQWNLANTDLGNLTDQQVEKLTEISDRIRTYTLLGYKIVFKPQVWTSGKYTFRGPVRVLALFNPEKQTVRIGKYPEGYTPEENQSSEPVRVNAVF